MSVGTVLLWYHPEEGKAHNTNLTEKTLHDVGAFFNAIGHSSVGRAAVL